MSSEEQLTLLTFPVITNINIPEVVADLMSCHPFDCMRGLQRIKNNAILFHLPPIHLQTNTKIKKFEKVCLVSPELP